MNQNITHGKALIPYDAKLMCWLPPEGRKQKNRRVYSRERALDFARRIDVLIGGGR